MIQKLSEKIFNINSNEEFEKLSLEIFNFQYKYNIIYQQYVNYLKIIPSEVDSIYKIPFLPIEFFKTKKIISNSLCFENENYTVFKSSGTTGQERSQHFVLDIKLYEQSFLNGFKEFFGDIKNYIIIGLLPSYLEAGNSSLVYMVDKLIKESKNANSGFYLNDLNNLADLLFKLEKQDKKLILFGVSYALVSLAKLISNKKFDNLIIIETGGMKGRKKEITREELHNILKNKFGIKHIYSEYGMTELLSQAYLKEDSLFYPSKTMKIMVRDLNDPFTYLEENMSGGLNIVDLANINSCSFIETKDLGKLKNYGFEVLGRFDNSDIRGCNLLIS